MVENEAPDEADPLDAAFAAYLRSCDDGEMTSRDDFLKQFPEVADQLRQLMEAADLVGRVGAAASSASHASEESLLAGGAETIATSAAVGEQSNVDPAATLPMAHRKKGDHGPTLPFNLGDYELLEILGKGGMGVVYLARQTELDRMVAVKMIRGGMLADESDVRRFYTEAQAAAKLSHPGIVPVYHFGQRAGHHFFSMAFIRGTDLQRRIQESPLAPRDAVRYVRDVARAIHHAHQNGVLHRDLKPANVMIDEHDRIHVTDFGLAKRMDSDSSVTGTGAAVGTPHYMAPEQAGGFSDQATRHSDVYALGAILFACITGRPPIMADTVVQTLLQVVHNPAPSLRSLRADVSMDLETIVAKCLEKDPKKRYDSASKLAEDLEAHLEGRPIAARPRSMPVKLWQWLEGVPLVAALSGRRMVHTSVSHRRFQAAMLLLLLLTPFAAAGISVLWNRNRDSIPATVAIAGGLEDGVYNEVSAKIAERLISRYHVTTAVTASNGSIDNRDRLLHHEVSLAPMQASAVNGDELCVVAPLFYEAVHVLARHDSEITSLTDLPGHRVAVGPVGSGSRATAEMLFDSLDLTPEVLPREVIPWRELASDDAPDAAVLCIGRGSPLLVGLLESNRWQLVPIPSAISISLQHPTLRPMTIESADYPHSNLPAAGIATVGTTAFLAARHDTPADLVTAALEILYQPPELCVGLISRKQAAEWQGLALHRAARKFYAGDTE
ncbi:serine/threonine-protein kinase [Novipirellula artificiosorum]|uniref:non-specific serine/threonine protein kinase n=1 Tax=Novipirellula artificiosorum TaxID=2528016 RepID=A0A5C6DVH0_9BACT|nr:serine/threonine-protein kinase [Novipirellula artificiosorum]TWU40690.1 Serine/threonine-protein kinase PrkC [Novipirellula artificiosorum]